jgi:hypothetical protein
MKSKDWTEFMAGVERFSERPSERNLYKRPERPISSGRDCIAATIR